MRKAVVDISAHAEERKRFLSRAIGASARPPVNLSSNMNIADVLVESKLLERSQARAATMDARARGVPVATVLGEQGAVPREKIVAAMESIDARMMASGLDFDVRLPREILRELKVICHGQTDRSLIISTNSNMSLVQQMLGPYLAGRDLIEVDFSWQKWAEFEQGLDKIIEPDTVAVSIDQSINPRSLIPGAADDAEVLDLLIERGALTSASDIHIEPQKQSYLVFFRINGIRQLVHTGKIEQYNRICAMVKDRARVDPMETRVPQDGSFSTQVRGNPYDIRVATVPSDGKEKITLRLLDPVRAHMRLSQLGITEVDEWKRICEYRNGLVLIVGATGSGKTTTLNATIREMERIEKAIYTAEDPVEYRINSVTHVQMNEAVGLDFARSIKAFMRSDPDVIILGEIRDPVTASKAIQAAETGHLVIATIHAESVPMALQRLRGLDVKVEDFEMLLRGVLVQFLIRTLCGGCGGDGCEICFGEGYAGRTVVSEIARVRNPNDVRKMMSTDPADKYWRPLWRDLEGKVLSGVTNGAEVYRTFSSELDELAEHSEVLAKILAEERAKRDLVSSNVAVASVEGMSEAERMQQRRLALAGLHVGGLSSKDEVEEDEARDSEPSSSVEAAE